MLKLHTTGNDIITIQPGERIAQIVFQECYLPNFDLVDDFDLKTTRSDNGFGSTGK